jgi:phosphoribosylanthranilate isomerase
MQQLWQNEQNFFDFSLGTKKPKLVEIFKNEFCTEIYKTQAQTKIDIIQMSGPL